MRLFNAHLMLITAIVFCSTGIATAQTAPANGGSRYGAQPSSGAATQPQARQPAVAPRQPIRQPIRQPQQPGARGTAQPATAVVPIQTRPRQPVVPFQLTPAGAAYRDQFLKIWETKSALITTFKCSFDLWEYKEGDRQWMKPGSQQPYVKNKGHIAYAKPDKASFLVEEVSRCEWNKTTGAETWKVSESVEGVKEVGARWVCDGKQVFNYDHTEKQLEVSPIPKEMQGKSIVDGPLPFLFGAKAEKIQARYWIRITRADDKEIWLDAYPKHYADALNYRRVELILHRDTLYPKAMQVYTPSNTDRSVYMFGTPKVNGTLDRLLGIFKPPKTPYGWTKVYNKTPQQAQPPRPRQVQQPTTGTAPRDARRLVPRSRF